MTDPVYSGEALLRNWSETANGKRRIVLEIEDNGGGHPFKGYQGERFAVVVVGPLANDENSVPRKGKAGGSASAPEGDAGSREARAIYGAKTSPVPNPEAVQDAILEHCGIPVTDGIANAVAAAAVSVTPGGGETGGSPSPLSLAPPVPKPKRRWSEMPPSQRAALLTGDPEFWRYLGTCGVHEPETATAADTSLKFLCGIQSKRELDEREKAASAFERLHGNFKAWQSARGHGVI